MKSFLIIGLGRFGRAIARKLCELGNEVLVIDRDADAVQHIADEVTHSIIGDATEEAVLNAAGARNFDCAIVAVASDIEDSVLATALLKEAGVPATACTGWCSSASGPTKSCSPRNRWACGLRVPSACALSLIM